MLVLIKAETFRDQLHEAQDTLAEVAFWAFLITTLFLSHSPINPVACISFNKRPSSES